MGNIEIIFIGSGDAFNAGGKANQAIWLRGPDAQILVDCGPTTLYRLQQMGRCPNDLDAIVFTHFHADHFIGVLNLDLALTLVWKRTEPIVYAAAKGLRKQFARLYQLGYPSFSANAQLPRRFKILKPGVRSNLVDSVYITGSPVSHNPESLGYRIEIAGKVIAITGDTGWFAQLPDLAAGADVFISECEYYRFTGNVHHLAYEQLEPIVAGCRTVLTHTGEELLKHRDQVKCEIAQDGTQIFL